MNRRLSDARSPQDGWTRRSLVEWLGKATVVALGADLIAACGGFDDVAEFGGSGESCEDPPFPFVPTTAVGHADWNERTVDPQDVTALIASWRLRVDGLVNRPVELSFADVVALTRQDQVTDFHCVEGWSLRDEPWNGVHLSEVSALVEPLPNASHVTFTTFGDVYTESLPLEVALEERTLLAYGVDCNTLPLKHGFPMRVVVPRKFGYKGAKAIRRIEFTDHPVDGFWVERGYSYEGDVQPERLRPGKY